jgi:hypothetical protein
MYFSLNLFPVAFYSGHASEFIILQGEKSRGKKRREEKRGKRWREGEKDRGGGETRKRER